MQIRNCIHALLLIVCIGIADSERPPVQFELVPSTRRTDASKEVVTTTDDGGMELDCSFECFVRNWCRAVVVNTVKPTCDLYVLQTYQGAGNIASDDPAFIYGEIVLQLAFPYITYTPGGFLTGSRIWILFKGSWPGFQLFFQFYNSKFNPLLTLAIDQSAGSVTRQGPNGVENDGVFPFDEHNVWEVEVVKATATDYAINVNGTLFASYTGSAGVEVATIQIYGDVDRFPLAIQLQEA